jgi:hypothetical protein
MNAEKEKESFVVTNLEAMLPAIRHVAQRGGDSGNVPKQ